MNDGRQYGDSVRACFWCAVSIVVTTVVLMLTSCRTVMYVPVETVRTDSVWRERWARDSVYVHDSVYVDRWMRGDTVFQCKTVTRYLYRGKLRTDTVAVTRTDSVGVPRPVERELTWRQRTRLKLFPVLLAVAAVLTFVVAWLARRIGKK